MSSNQTPKPCTHRHAVCLAVFLKTKCFICFGDPDAGIPSSELGSCRKYAHESCLLSCFNVVYNRTGLDQQASFVPTCPHCRTRLILYHRDGVWPAELPGTGAFAFSYIQFTTCCNIRPISVVADKFENQCLLLIPQVSAGHRFAQIGRPHEFTDSNVHSSFCVLFFLTVTTTKWYFAGVKSTFSLLPHTKAFIYVLGGNTSSYACFNFNR